MESHIKITDEIILMFKKKPTAMIIWMDAIIQTSSNPSYIPRREYFRKKFCLGESRMRKAMKFLKNHGLVETYPVYKNGKISGAEYKFYNLETAIKNPSPSISPGPQPKTKFIAEKKQRTPLNGNVSEWLKTDYSENIKMDNPCLIPFNSSNPDDHKKNFLDHFTGHKTFQTFDDSKDKKRHLSKIYETYNTLGLDAKNNQGAGIFLNINEADGKGRKKGNIIRVRAVFADLDGAPLEPVLSYNPSLVVESSPGRYHAYWVTYDTPLESFSIIQKAIIQKFNSDPKVFEVCRVMRIPGHYHHKTDPVLSKILFTSENRYSFDELKKMFLETKPITHGVNKGERNSRLCKIIGGMKKGNLSEGEIKKQAYNFAELCNPPLEKYNVDSVLMAAKGWKTGNEEMTGKKNAQK